MSENKGFLFRNSIASKHNNRFDFLTLSFLPFWTEFYSWRPKMSVNSFETFFCQKINQRNVNVWNYFFLTFSNFEIPFKSASSVDAKSRFLVRRLSPRVDSSVDMGTTRALLKVKWSVDDWYSCVGQFSLCLVPLQCHNFSWPFAFFRWSSSSSKRFRIKSILERWVETPLIIRTRTQSTQKN